MALLALRRLEAENGFGIHAAIWAAASALLVTLNLLTGLAVPWGVAIALAWGLGLAAQGLAAGRRRRKLDEQHRDLLAAHRLAARDEAADGVTAQREQLLRSAEDARAALRTVSPETVAEVSRGEAAALTAVAWLDQAARLAERHRADPELRRRVATRLSQPGETQEHLRTLLAELDRHDRKLAALEREAGERRSLVESFLLALENAKIAGGGRDLAAVTAPLRERVALLEQAGSGDAGGPERPRPEERSQSAAARIREEVRLARDLQRSILPAGAPEVPGLEVAHLYRPSSEVGGDFYDFYSTAPGRLLVALGDASGHGLDSSIVSSMAKSALYMQVSGGRGLAESMAEINRMMYDTLGRRRLMTLTLLELDTGRRTISWVNAGQVYPLLRRDGRVSELEQPGYPLGVRRDLVPELGEVELRAGDLLVLLTDGYVEAVDDAGRSYGWERLTKRLEKAEAAGAASLLRQLSGELDAYLGAATPQDDVTLITIRFEP
ncbi:MAG: SpoIIE family protein phosphatase [bacterium]|nr:SpoIIE family protein phosphatase [bacterium]